MTPIVIAFFAYMVIVGSAIGALVVGWPKVENFALPPLFWVFGLMALFEVVAGYALARPLGTVITMPQRIAGLIIGVGLAMLIPYFAQNVR